MNIHFHIFSTHYNTLKIKVNKNILQLRKTKQLNIFDDDIIDDLENIDDYIKITNNTVININDNIYSNIYGIGKVINIVDNYIYHIKYNQTKTTKKYSLLLLMNGAFKIKKSTNSNSDNLTLENMNFYSKLKVGDKIRISLNGGNITTKEISNVDTYSIKFKNDIETYLFSYLIYNAKVKLLSNSKNTVSDIDKDYIKVSDISKLGKGDTIKYEGDEYKIESTTQYGIWLKKGIHSKYIYNDIVLKGVYIKKKDNDDINWVNLYDRTILVSGMDVYLTNYNTIGEILDVSTNGNIINVKLKKPFDTGTFKIKNIRLDTQRLIDKKSILIMGL